MNSQYILIIFGAIHFSPLLLASSTAQQSKQLARASFASTNYQPRKQNAATQTDPFITTLSTSVETSNKKTDKFEGYTLYAPRWSYSTTFIKCPNDIDPNKEEIPAPEESNIGKALPNYSIAALTSMGFTFHQKNSFEPGQIVLSREIHDHIWWTYGTVAQITDKFLRDFGRRDEDEYTVNTGAGYGIILKSLMIIKYPQSFKSLQSSTSNK